MQLSDELTKLNQQWELLNNKNFLSNKAVYNISEFIHTINLAAKSKTLFNKNSRVYEVNAGLVKLAIDEITQAINVIDTLNSEDAAQIQIIYKNFNVVINCIHALLILSANQNNDPKLDLSVVLANQVAQLKEADQDIEHHINQFNKSAELIAKIEDESGKIPALVDAVSKAYADVVTLLEQANSSLVDINATKTEISAVGVSVDKDNEAIANIKVAIEGYFKTISEKLDDKAGELDELTEEASKLENTIKGLLPKATSAGLASSFSDRAIKLDWSKRGWCTAFVLSILILCGLGYHFMSVLGTQINDTNYWRLFLQKLPLSAPFVWLAWFSAIQYGNTIRLQEDYEFKCTSAKAFVGYKDYLEYISKIETKNNEGTAVNAMALLAEKTINTLSTEPGRILAKSHRDASMFSWFFNVGKK